MQKELISLLKKMTFLLIFFFIIFILALNLLKLADFIVKIDDVIKKTTADAENNEIPVVKSIFNGEQEDPTTNYNQNIAHTAKQMGYQDCMSTLDQDEWYRGYNILLIGSDKKDFHVKKSRADVIIIIRISEKGKILSMSIPRDSLITISEGKNAGYQDKIGHSLFWDGVDQLKLNVERLTSIMIDKTIIVDNFKSFEAFIAIIGGVPIDEVLEGKLGIQWIRNRSFKYGDIERCRRQQLFLKKAIKRLWHLSKNGNYIYANFTYNALRKIVETDINKDDFIKILYLLRTNNFNPETHFYTAVLPGSFGVFDSELMQRENLTCWIPDNNCLEKLQITFGPNADSILPTAKINLMSFVIYDIQTLNKKAAYKMRKLRKSIKNKTTHAQIIKNSPKMTK